MKMNLKIVVALAFIGSAGLLFAEETNQVPAEAHTGAGGPGGRMVLPPLVKALDANDDGVIDADEVANASKALLTLDKDGDGKLTREEFRPPRPEGQSLKQ